MKTKLNLLFVCEGNTVRSPTFENWFLKNRGERYNVKSAGTRCLQYGEKLTEELLKWADMVYVMDLEQEMTIARKFPEFKGKVKVVGCGDYYTIESPQLIRLIEYWANKNDI